MKNQYAYCYGELKTSSSLFANFAIDMLEEKLKSGEMTFHERTLLQYARNTRDLLDEQDNRKKI